MKKILVPVDGSSFAMNAVNEAKKLAEAFGSEIVLLTVVNYNLKSDVMYTGGVTDIQPVVVRAKADAEKNLADAMKALGDLGSKTKTELLYGDPADQILDYLKTNDVDYVVMGSAGMGFSSLRRLFVGSVTNKILQNVSQPVLIVK